MIPGLFTECVCVCCFFKSAVLMTRLQCKMCLIVYIYILCIYIVYYINLHHILYINIFQVVPRLETERLENKVLTLRKTS